MENPSQPTGVSRPCPACKSPVETGHKFCEVCGAKLDELPACPKCGATFIAPVKFCELCGTPTGHGAEGDEADQDQPVYKTEPDPPESYPESEYLPEPEYMPEYSDIRGPEPESGYPEETNTLAEPVQTRFVPEPDFGQEPEEKPAPAREPLPDLPSDILAPDSPVRESPEHASGSTSPPASGFSRKTALIAGGIVVLLVIAAVVYFFGLPLISNTHGSPGTAIKSLVPTATPVPVPTTMLVITPTRVRTTVPPAVVKTKDTSLVPVATDAMPKNQEVFFSVQKDPVDSVITVQYQRGPGENAFSSAEVKVTVPDGGVQTKVIQPSKGVAEVTIPGSKSLDRVEVIAKMYSGQSYRVYDDLLK